MLAVVAVQLLRGFAVFGFGFVVVAVVLFVNSLLLLVVLLPLARKRCCVPLCARAVIDRLSTVKKGYWPPRA